MRRFEATALLAAWLLLVSCGNDANPAGLSGNPPPSADPQVVDFVSLVNAHRASVGCGPLAWHGPTAGVAQGHSQDMVDRDFFSHTNPDGESPFDRMANAGIQWQGMAGENIALTPGGAESVLTMWLGSAGHRSNIEQCAYTHHGVGLAQGHWTHVFLQNPVQ